MGHLPCLFEELDCNENIEPENKLYKKFDYIYIVNSSSNFFNKSNIDKLSNLLKSPYKITPLVFIIKNNCDNFIVTDYMRNKLLYRIV